MKKIALLAAMAFSLFTASSTNAQVRVNIQIGAPVAQQSWYSYDDDYYYMPEQGVYYNVNRGMYVYPEGGSWLSAAYLPVRYGGVAYNNSRYYRVRERAPFQRNDYYRRQYPVSYNNGGANYGGHRGGRDFDRRDNNGNGRGQRDNHYQGNSGGGYGGSATHYNRR